MSTRLVYELNRLFETTEPGRLTELLEGSTDLADAVSQAGLEMNDLERRFLSSLPDELAAGMKASLLTALASGRAVTVDWAPGFAPEVGISVPETSGHDAVTILLRTPRPIAGPDATSD